MPRRLNSNRNQKIGVPSRKTESATNGEPTSDRPIIQNVVPAEVDTVSDNRIKVLVARTLSEIVQDVVGAMYGFPKRVGNSIFVVDTAGGPKVRFLPSTDALFAEMGHYADVRWGGVGKKIIINLSG